MTASVHDPKWLARQYSTRRRPVADIAAEAGVDPSNVYRALARHAIPLRGAAGRRVIDERAARKAIRSAPTIRDAARSMGVPQDSLREWAQRHGLHPLGPAGPEDLAARYQAGASTLRLAGEERVAVRTIGRWLRAQGVVMRPRGRPAQ